MAMFKEIPSLDAYQKAIEDFRKAHNDELARVESELCKLIDDAKDAVEEMSIPQYKLECLKLAQGDIDHAALMFAFVMGGDK